MRNDILRPNILMVFMKKKVPINPPMKEIDANHERSASDNCPSGDSSIYVSINHISLQKPIFTKKYTSTFQHKYSRRKPSRQSTMRQCHQISFRYNLKKI